MFNKISVQTTTKDDYFITIGENLLDELNHFLLAHYSTDKIIVIIDQQVHLFHNDRIDQSLQDNFAKVLTYVVPSGEASKSLDQYCSIVDFVLNAGVERNTVILAIGGGVVGDLAGYVAATVLRGIPLIQVPTTLLAMVDSSIGGKTGINHSKGKNLIGSFYQPKAVYADVSFLKTLPKKEWVNGLSEIIKYGMIETPELLDELGELVKQDDFDNPGKWVSVIQKSAAIKVNLVQRDVKEGGVRAYLNFGHTYAHVIERLGDYESFSHGEAVFAGMFGAIKASSLLGAEINDDKLKPFKPYYSFNLSSIADRFDEFIPLMLRDKKVKDSNIRLVLLNAMADPYVKMVDNENLIHESWKYILDHFN